MTTLYYCTALPVEMRYLELIEWTSPAGVLQEYRLVEHVSAKWRQFGRQLNLTEDTLDGWHTEALAVVRRCWEKVMQAWLGGQGQREYPPTWEGLYKLLRDVKKEAVVPVLREAVDRAVLPGTSMLYSKVCNRQLNCVCFSTRLFPVMAVLLLLLFKRVTLTVHLTAHHLYTVCLHYHVLFSNSVLLIDHGVLQ